MNTYGQEIKTVLTIASTVKFILQNHCIEINSKLDESHIPLEVKPMVDILDLIKIADIILSKDAGQSKLGGIAHTLKNMIITVEQQGAHKAPNKYDYEDLRIILSESGINTPEGMKWAILLLDAMEDEGLVKNIISSKSLRSFVSLPAHSTSDDGGKLSVIDFKIGLHYITNDHQVLDKLNESLTRKIDPNADSVYLDGIFNPSDKTIKDSLRSKGHMTPEGYSVFDSRALKEYVNNPMKQRSGNIHNKIDPLVNSLDDLNNSLLNISENPIYTTSVKLFDKVNGFNATPENFNYITKSIGESISYIDENQDSDDVDTIMEVIESEKKIFNNIAKQEEVREMLIAMNGLENNQVGLRDSRGRVFYAGFTGDYSLSSQSDKATMVCISPTTEYMLTDDGVYWSKYYISELCGLLPKDELFTFDNLVAAFDDYIDNNGIYALYEWASLLPHKKSLLAMRAITNFVYQMEGKPASHIIELDASSSFAQMFNIGLCDDIGGYHSNMGRNTSKFKFVDVLAQSLNIPKSVCKPLFMEWTYGSSSATSKYLKGGKRQRDTFKGTVDEYFPMLRSAMRGITNLFDCEAEYQEWRQAITGNRIGYPCLETEDYDLTMPMSGKLFRMSFKELRNTGDATPIIANFIQGLDAQVLIEATANYKESVKDEPDNLGYKGILTQFDSMAINPNHAHHVFDGYQKGLSDMVQDQPFKKAFQSNGLEVPEVFDVPDYAIEYTKEMIKQSPYVLS